MGTRLRVGEGVGGLGMVVEGAGLGGWRRGRIGRAQKELCYREAGLLIFVRAVEEEGRKID